MFPFHYSFLFVSSRQMTWQGRDGTGAWSTNRSKSAHYYVTHNNRNTHKYIRKLYSQAQTSHHCSIICHSGKALKGNNKLLHPPCPSDMHRASLHHAFLLCMLISASVVVGRVVQMVVWPNFLNPPPHPHPHQHQQPMPLDGRRNTSGTHTQAVLPSAVTGTWPMRFPVPPLPPLQE